MSLYQVIASTAQGSVYELDLRALDACTAVTLAGTEIRDQEPDAIITNVHARRLGNGAR